MTAVVAWLLPALRATAAPCDPPIVNPILCENSKAGSPATEWDVSGSGSSTIEGFATDFSVDQGETVRFKVNTPATDYRLDVYRMGYYGGMGARKIVTVEPSASLPQSQPTCLLDSVARFVDCGNWAVSASWPVPADAVSGIYFARLVREDGPTGASHVYFVVRDDGGGSDLLFQTSDTTWQAYNRWGGYSLYYPTKASRGYKVSYNRPFATRDCCARDFLFSTEYPMVRWLEANGYDVSYFTGVDSDRNGDLIPEHRVFLSVGHDEYWSGQQRASVEAARDAGTHLAFFSGNEVFWKTRWEPSIDGTSTPHRTLVSYKETHNDAPIDPADPPIWTGTWRDPRFSPPADGGRPENALTGTAFAVNGYRDDAITVPAADGKARFWRNTSVATLPSGGTATLPTGVLGYEWDSNPDNGFRPPGLFNLSTTTLPVTGQLLVNYGSNYVSGTATHNLTLYRASSGALVFGSGTIQWPWGLDGTHDGTTRPPDIRMQQATVNLLADMGVQPASLQSGLVAASMSTDLTDPTSLIDSPVSGSSVQSGSPVTVSGTANDAGEGVVAGVEVSTDGGETWHPATGRVNWSYAWTPQTPGPTTVLSRAVDDTGNLRTPAGIPITVEPPSCPCTIWPASAAPGTTSTSDSRSIEVGVRFRPNVDGFVSGIRFYKGTANTGTHVGRLWTNGGSLLAQATFTGESSSGWQQVTFSSPVEVTAGTTYVASYTAPNGGYAKDAWYFATQGMTGWPLEAPADWFYGRQGVYRYGSGLFPTKSSQSSNYWVDVVFDLGAADTTPPIVTGRSPAPGATGVSTTTQVTASFSESVQAGSISFVLRDPGNAAVPATVSYDDPSRTATLTPDAPLAPSTTYTATVSGARDQAGNEMTTPDSWSFTTGTGPSCPCSIWDDATTPAVASANDTNAVELGVRFRTSVGGYITGIRFYKGTANTGTHIGSLWTSSGALLASVMFTGETASGWQQATFSSPVAVTADTTYVASYFAPVGRYAKDVDYFATSGVTNGPLTALANGVDGGNGVYTYGGGFPTKTSKTTNYWVDVVFATSP